MRILLTGSSGLLGSKISELAVNRGYEIYAAYNSHSPSYGTPLQLDITNREKCRSFFYECRPDVVIHAAALTNVNICERNKEFRLDRGLIRPITSDEIKWVARRAKNSSLNVQRALSELVTKPISIRDAVRKMRHELMARAGL